MSELNYVLLEQIEKSDRIKYFDYLLMADESEEVVKEYLFDGDLFAIILDGKAAGAVLFTFETHDVVELKNIAISCNETGKGIGKLVIEKAFSIYKKRNYKRMIVGTANSSIDNLAFYQKAGFRMYEIKKDFFKKYPQPIYENGIRALDMLMFYKELQVPLMKQSR
ncbi:GNAT family N-acetyltransferase [Bacillus sp. M6-12]|uniref:GNAT family N-acetyltransferase n=1 Tax=Bacillus sp. M6-12 TaxID=2054166 RepID=UPI000C7622B9|nr:GNAT family N-acetyltransferase [Bacillus sp. M6-12]PLS17250.1 GNAT family N-acetyltransferase [Bacillus sp. M6-12]